MADDETADEERDAARDGETPSEAHREGEFNDLRDLIAALSGKVDSLMQMMVSKPADGAGDDDGDGVDGAGLIDIDSLKL